MKLTKTQQLTRTALFAAIIIVLAMTPLGYIPINPAIQLTIIVMPVVVGGMLYGWRTGLILGIVFGLTSFYKAFSTPVGQIMLTQSALLTFATCVVPRAIVGLYSGLMHKLLKNEKLQKTPIYAMMGLGGSLTNTIFYLGFLYVLFDSALTGFTLEVILAVVSFNGILEAIFNAVLVAILMRILLRVEKIGIN